MCQDSADDVTSGTIGLPALEPPPLSARASTNYSTLSRPARPLRQTRRGVVWQAPQTTVWASFVLPVRAVKKQTELIEVPKNGRAPALQCTRSRAQKPAGAPPDGAMNKTPYIDSIVALPIRAETFARTSGFPCLVEKPSMDEALCATRSSSSWSPR